MEVVKMCWLSCSNPNLLKIILTFFLLFFGVQSDAVVKDYECSSTSTCVSNLFCKINGVVSQNLKWCDEAKSKVCCPNGILYEKTNKEPSYEDSSYSSYSSYSNGYKTDPKYDGKHVPISSKPNSKYVPINDIPNKGYKDSLHSKDYIVDTKYDSKYVPINDKPNKGYKDSSYSKDYIVDTKYDSKYVPINAKPNKGYQDSSHSNGYVVDTKYDSKYVPINTKPNKGYQDSSHSNGYVVDTKYDGKYVPINSKPNKDYQDFSHYNDYVVDIKYDNKYVPDNSKPNKGINYESYQSYHSYPNDYDTDDKYETKYVPVNKRFDSNYELEHGLYRGSYRDYYDDNEHFLSKEAQRVLKAYEEKECGVRRSFYGKISTGHEVDLGITKYGEFPWQAAILLRVEEKFGNREAFKFVCGGTVLNPKLILTAAHCIKGVWLKNLKVKLGEWNLKGSQGEMFPSIERKIERAVIHEYYNSATFAHDIAILVLDKPVNLRKTPHVSQICLPSKRTKFDEYSKCYIVGWGNDIYKPNYGSNILKVASVSLMKQDCRHKLKKSIPSLSNNFLKEDISCISGSLGKDACVGDGGGAVICPLKNTKVPVCRKGYSCDEEHYFIAGVISWGSDKCGQEDSVTVVTDFGSHYDWILDKTRKYGGVGQVSDDKSRNKYGSSYDLYGYDDFVKNDLKTYDEYGTPYDKHDYDYDDEYGFDDKLDYRRRRFDNKRYN